MKQVDEQGLDEFLAERDSANLPVGSFFQGTVTAIRGVFPSYDVQVRRTGEPGSDGHWHKCATPGYTPALGDIVDLIKRDNTFSHVVAPLSSTAFVSQGPAKIAPTIVLPTTVASTSFSGIPGSFTHLWCVWRARSAAGSPTTINIRLNDDSGALAYDVEFADFIGNATTAPTQALGTNLIRIGALAASGADNVGGHFYVFDYTRTGTAMRRILNWYGWRNDSNGTGVEMGAANWRNTTDPVTKITFTAGAVGLETGIFNLYGI